MVETGPGECQKKYEVNASSTKDKETKFIKKKIVGRQFVY